MALTPAERQRRYRLAHPEKVAAYRESRKERERAFYAANREVIKARANSHYRNLTPAQKRDRVAKAAALRRANPAANSRYSRKWRAANREAVRAQTNARRRELRVARPAWADEVAIRRFYRNCPKGYHVDHVIPIRGKTVCGLHVETNLQYLPARDNVRKSNRWAA